MPEPGKADMGGNPLQEGILADNGWQNRQKRDESFASVTAANDTAMLGAGDIAEHGKGYCVYHGEPHALLKELAEGHPEGGPTLNGLPFDQVHPWHPELGGPKNTGPVPISIEHPDSRMVAAAKLILEHSARPMNKRDDISAIIRQPRTAGYDNWLEAPYRDHDDGIQVPCPECDHPLIEVDTHTGRCENCGYVDHDFNNTQADAYADSRDPHSVHARLTSDLPAGYDAWRTGPPDQGPLCPHCEHPLEIDRHEQSEHCLNCGYENGRDWDAERDLKLERDWQDRHSAEIDPEEAYREIDPIEEAYRDRAVKHWKLPDTKTRQYAELLYWKNKFPNIPVEELAQKHHWHEGPWDPRVLDMVQRQRQRDTDEGDEPNFKDEYPIKEDNVQWGPGGGVTDMREQERRMREQADRLLKEKWRTDDENRVIPEGEADNELDQQLREQAEKGRILNEKMFTPQLNWQPGSPGRGVIIDRPPEAGPPGIHTWNYDPLDQSAALMHSDYLRSIGINPESQDTLKSAGLFHLTPEGKIEERASQLQPHHYDQLANAGFGREDSGGFGAFAHSPYLSNVPHSSWLIEADEDFAMENADVIPPGGQTIDVTSPVLHNGNLGPMRELGVKVDGKSLDDQEVYRDYLSRSGTPKNGPITVALSHDDPRALDLAKRMAEAGDGMAMEDEVGDIVNTRHKGAITPHQGIDDRLHQALGAFDTHVSDPDTGELVPYRKHHERIRGGYNGGPLQVSAKDPRIVQGIEELVNSGNAQPLLDYQKTAGIIGDIGDAIGDVGGAALDAGQAVGIVPENFSIPELLGSAAWLVPGVGALRGGLGAAREIGGLSQLGQSGAGRAIANGALEGGVGAPINAAKAVGRLPGAAIGKAKTIARNPLVNNYLKYKGIDSTLNMGQQNLQQGTAPPMNLTTPVQPRTLQQVSHRHAVDDWHPSSDPIMHNDPREVKDGDNNSVYDPGLDGTGGSDDPNGFGQDFEAEFDHFLPVLLMYYLSESSARQHPDPEFQQFLDKLESTGLHNAAPEDHDALEPAWDAIQAHLDGGGWSPPERNKSEHITSEFNDEEAERVLRNELDKRTDRDGPVLRYLYGDNPVACPNCQPNYLDQRGSAPVPPKELKGCEKCGGKGWINAPKQGLDTTNNPPFFGDLPSTPEGGGVIREQMDTPGLVNSRPDRWPEVTIPKNYPIRQGNVPNLPVTGINPGHVPMPPQAPAAPQAPSGVQGQANCPRCGAPISPGATTCEACGSGVGTSQPGQVVAFTPNDIQQWQTPQPTAPVGQGQDIEAPAQAVPQADFSAASCPSCGYSLPPGSAICPHCNSPAMAKPTTPQQQQVVPQVNTAHQGSNKWMDKTAAPNHSGPHNNEQFAAVAELLQQENRQDEIPTMLAEPWNYAEEMARVQNKQIKPPIDDTLSQDPPQPAQEEAPPGATMPVPGMSVPGQPTASVDESIMEALEKHASPDSYAPRCPRCNSGTTGLISEDGDIQCHACGNLFKKDIVKDFKTGFEYMADHDHNPGLSGDPNVLGVPAADQERQEDHREEQDSSLQWVDNAGSPLKVGQEYEMQSPNYSIPDIVRITAVKPDSIEYELTGEFGLSHQTEVTKEEADIEGIEFSPADSGDQEITEEGLGHHDDQRQGVRPGETHDQSTPHVLMTKRNYTGEEYANGTYCEDYGHSVSDTDGKCVYCDAQVKEPREPSHQIDEHVDMPPAPDDLRHASRGWLLGDESASDTFPTEWTKTAGKKYTPTQQREFIDEQGEARNRDKLNLAGTHYEEDDGLDLLDDFLFGL